MATSKLKGRCAICGGAVEPGSPIRRTARGWAHADEVTRLHQVIRDGMDISDARAWIFVLPPLPRKQDYRPAGGATSGPIPASALLA